MKSKKKRFQQEDDQAFFEERDEGETDRLQHILAGLIGKKMGIEQLNILTELQYRNLNHFNYGFRFLDFREFIQVRNKSCSWKKKKVFS